MQLRADQLRAHLHAAGTGGLKPLYVIQGDEPLLAQEAGDAIRAAARAAGFGERKVFVVSGAHFDWSALLGAAQTMSLFAQRQLIEVRLASGKPQVDISFPEIEKFDALPPAQQKALVDAAHEAGQYQRKLNADNTSVIIGNLKKAGVQVVENVDPKPFLEATKPVRQTFVAKFGGDNYIKAIDAIRDTK